MRAEKERRQRDTGERNKIEKVRGLIQDTSVQSKKREKHKFDKLGLILNSSRPNLIGAQGGSPVFAGKNGKTENAKFISNGF